jgi:hypothetical protein
MLSPILCWPVCVEAAAIGSPTSAGADIDGTGVLAGRGIGQPVKAKSRAFEVGCLSLDSRTGADCAVTVD